MPAVVCHWLLGKRLLDRAKEIAGEENFSENSFFAGCQGLDVLFYHRLVSLQRKRSLAAYGSRMHTDHPSELFASVKRTLANSGELYGRVLSYALGLCCHYAYDTCAHPYVCQLHEYMKQNDERGSGYHYHAHIESALDVIMLRYETGGLTADLRLGKCVRFEKPDRDAAALIYRDALRDIYGVTTDDKNISLLLPHMRRLFRLLDDPTGIWRPLVINVEKLMGMSSGPMSAYMRPFMEDDSYDYANIAQEEWQNFMDASQTSSEDFVEITDRAESESEKMMRFFMTAKSAADFAAYTGERSFSNNVDEGAAVRDDTVI